MTATKELVIWSILVTSLNSPLGSSENLLLLRFKSLNAEVKKRRSLKYLLIEDIFHIYIK